MNNDKEMNIREKSYYRFKKFTRFLKEKKLYGRFKKKVISVCTRQNKMILFAQPYDSDTNIIETHYMIKKNIENSMKCTNSQW